MHPTARITLSPVSDLTEPDRAHLQDAFTGEPFTWGAGPATTFAEALTYYRSIPGGWVVHVDHEPAGLIGIHPSLVLPAPHVQPSAILTPAHRSTGLVTVLLQAIHGAFAAHQDRYRLFIGVQAGNTRSLAAVRRTFPHVTDQHAWFPISRTAGRIFPLWGTPVSPSTPAERDIRSTLTTWLTTNPDMHWHPRPSITLEPITDPGTHAAALAADWDWHLGDQPDPASYLAARFDRPGFYLHWVHVDGAPAGLFAILPCPDHHAWQTSTYLTRPHRGTPVNPALKHAAVQAFTTMNQPLVASIDERNTRARESMTRFTGTPGTRTVEPLRDRTAYVHHLAGPGVPPPLLAGDPQLVATLLTLADHLHAHAGLNHP
jgi:hypothetical protein